MKKLPIFILSAILLFSGCSSNTAEESYSIGAPLQSTISSNCNSYTNGTLYSDNNALYFWSFEAMSSTPLCNKPSCDHKKSDCISKLILNDGTTTTPPVIYHDKVYYFSYTDKIVEGNQDGETSYEVDGKLQEIDLNTGEAKTVCALENMEAAATDNLVLIDNLLYFVANNGALQSEDGTWQYFTTAGKQWLCSVNLDTGELTNYGRVNEDEKVDTTLFTIGNSAFGINGNVKLDGIYNNKIYMHYYSVSDSDSFLKFFEQYNTFPDSDDAAWETSYVTFDLNSKEISLNESQQTIIATENHCIFWDGEQYVDETGETQTVLEGVSKNKYAAIYEETLWFSDITMQYTDIVDLTTGDRYQLNAEYSAENFRVLAKLDSDYIVKRFGEDGSVSFEKLPESELLESVS